MEHGPIDHEGAPLDGPPLAGRLRRPANGSPAQQSGRRLNGRARWAVPAAAVLAVGGVVAGTTAAGAQSAPSLPARSAAQLLTDVATSAGPGPLTGTVQETANLGLPALPSSDSPSGSYSMLTGTHTFNIWSADPAHLRISEPVQMGESDLRVDGRQVWLWNSKTQTATHIVAGAPASLPSGSFAEPLKPGFMPRVYKAGSRVCVIRPSTGQLTKKCAKVPAGKRLFFRARPGHSFPLPKPLIKPNMGMRPVKVTKLPGNKIRITFANGKTVKLPAHPGMVRPPKNLRATQPPTPQQATRQILAALGPTTRVSVQRNVTVAGQAAYQLSLAPKDSRSLVSRVQIAIDAAKHFPLQVQVFARGSAGPAFQIGFTALSFGRPAASNFSFTPPAGAKVHKTSLPVGSMGLPLRLLGPASGADRSIAGGAWLPGGLPYISAPRVMGQGWLSVLVVQSPVSTGGSQVFSNPGSAGTHVTVVPQGSVTSSDSSSASSEFVVSGTSDPSGRALSYQYSAGASSLSPAQLGPLLKATTPVHGKWGSGRLLRTSLLDILITNKGTVLAGAVRPSVLYADAAALR